MSNVKLFHFANMKQCEGCEGSVMQINEYGVIIPCQMCAGSYKAFSNKYGTDKEEHPEFYSDHTETKSMSVKIDQKADHLFLPDGRILNLKTI